MPNEGEGGTPIPAGPLSFYLNFESLSSSPSPPPERASLGMDGLEEHNNLVKMVLFSLLSGNLPRALPL